MRLSRPLVLTLMGLFLTIPVFAQEVLLTREDLIMQPAPSWTGQTGLFEMVTGTTLRQGDFSFGIYYNNFDLAAGSAREFAPLSARPYEDMVYDLHRVSASIGFGITDRWEISAMLPWDRIVQNAGDRAGFINGWLYNEGEFTDSGLGNARLATKFGLGPTDGTTQFALSGFVDLGTGDDDGGISTGATDLGIGGHLTFQMVSLGLTYVVRGDRDSSNAPGVSGEVGDILRVDGGLNIPVGRTISWITELNAIFYSGGARDPDNPIFLVTGLRHWFGNSGWALNGALRWTVTEASSCPFGGLVGLTYAPFRLAAALPPPPAPIITPPPPPPPAPVRPPEPPPVTPPRLPQLLREDEIHFEPGSARLTNIAKAILDDVALRMKQEPSSTALVIGYTDTRENTGPNNDLDRRRAEAVRDYLVSRHGIDPSRITVEGRDAREPVADNATAEGRLRNRRVVIRLMLP